jgi:ubiquitin-protein ligase
MSYPRAVVVRRLVNELKECSAYLGTDFEIDPETVTLPLEMEMGMSNVIGYESKDKIITDHRFRLTITEDYGQSKPEVRWVSHVFHPNIMDPDDGGLVCMKMLSDWSYGTRLASFIKGLETLVSNPNPESAFGTASCEEAAAFFSENGARFDAKVSSGAKRCL